MDALVQKIISDSGDEFSKNIIVFQENYGNRTVFEELNNDQLREKLWETLFHCLSDNSQSSLHYNCLSTLRILSRDKTKLNELITDERLGIILNNAALRDININLRTYSNVNIEALKLLCNLIFNSIKVQELLPKTHCLPCLIDRIRKYNEKIPYEIMLFDTRIVFLITALNISTRQVVKTELNGDECFIKMLKNICIQCEQDKLYFIKEDNAILVCEILKALFNLYINSDNTTGEKSKNLVSILNKLLLFKSKKDNDLQSNIANLLTVMPYNCYSEIISPTKEKHKQVFQNMDMSAVFVLLKFLDRRLNCKDDLIGNLSPIVTAFIRMVKAERLIRKYTRLQILPPLKDVMHRPEEGTTLRAKLCKLLTSPLIELRDLVAEFLFILCKENVTRMVKYTGYGNAAGMFANKGLLGPNKKIQPAYSSESEDSETEEYLKHKEQINPVTGCFEHPKPNPLEGMSEEQKEYEALQLIGLVDKLTREGVVQPCRIGDDGKPKPIEHVLELQEELPKQQYNHRDSDSD
ncbi:synembryn [Apis mellifera caucasica]|uniref:Synembryn n=1 Tax=Apis mellifera TaxID=7460 RepID=A0A7M7LM36_APIME|nr:synembryn [Apis mellifera]XP_006558928.1 synembryn [Apis mellifera]XP_395308.3 synembryn [Apis mellifera]KAG6803181.1 synembryn [Apis mellifera caucasica]KAG9431653.1 synembryn [Apis mellifera carnica]|eukprot:XP_006558927.1 synembryn [Apis mellifera]